MKTFEKVYDSSVKNVEIDGSVAIISIIISHLVVAPLRFVGRVSSNICMLPRKVSVSIFYRALLLNTLFVLYGVYVGVFKYTPTFLYGSLVAICITFIIHKIVNKNKCADIDNTEQTLNFNQKEVEDFCNNLPKELEKEVKELRR